MRKLLLTALLATGAAAFGQPQPQPQDDQPRPIVVQGVRDQEKEIGRFVDALTDAPVLGQLSRFNWAVCPSAVGLGDAHNAAIVRRMLEVARAAAIPAAGSGCRPNVLLIVTRDKGEFIDRLSRKYPAYFTGVNNADIRRMIRERSPAAAWHVEGRLDADGLEVQHDIDGRHISERTDTPSRVTTSSRPHFIASVVVVELGALSGLTTTQLADYAAMRGFARTDPRRLAAKSSAQTILTAIEAPMDSLIPVTLTQWDLAFLKSLYASSPDRTATRQRNEMKRIVEQDLRKKQQGN
jgi:hypothetical protein